MSEISKKEEEVLKFWQDKRIFEKSLQAREDAETFVFYEGPPYANGRPGIHHTESRVFKDIILRYKTMAGFYVPRRAGWDTHGLPTEMEVEKILGVKSKKEIEEKIGIEKFIEECRKNVFLYKEEWEKFTERIGYWLDLENAYVTMENYYIETLWWIIKEISKKGLLYEDYKVLPWCPRCQTALSSHEVAQGYKKIKEDSITIKFELIDEPKTYVLAWTTTPWTLPGNVALAVNPDIDYIKFFLRNYPGISDGIYITSKEDFEPYKNETGVETIEQIKGRDLISKKYKPLYPNEAPYIIISGDFVTVEEGTGVVHIAPAFGEDDMKAWRQIPDSKFPARLRQKTKSLAGGQIPKPVNEEGKMITPGYKWDGLFIKEANPLIIEDLKNRDLLFHTEMYEHDYPFCWRCESPLMYYAKNSWFLKTTAVKQRMIDENSKINWYPSYLREGRFGEWLKDLRDWAISRERYWGAPLPVWRCEKCKEINVIGSINEIRVNLNKLNKIFLIRHGEAENNINDILSSLPEIKEYHLTEKGRQQSKDIAEILKKEKIDLVFSSPLLRAKETAEIISRRLNIEIIFDERLQEIGLGEFNGKNLREFGKRFPTKESRAENANFGVESGREIRKRLENFLEDINKKYSNKNIVVISHGDPIQIFYGITQGLNLIDSFKGWYPDKGSLKIVYSKKFDLHKPYIDEIILDCEKCKGKMKRVPEVMDVWFDSGAMPFAQAHWPFAQSQSANWRTNLKSQILQPKDYPADYICEGIDQTRGWFYTLLAVSSLLGLGRPYKNVISLGLVLDEKGQKMSKSKGNVVEPMDLIEKYGADAVRWYFYTINQPWDEKLFNEKDVALALRRFLMIFWNCVIYWKTYSLRYALRVTRYELIINKWIVAKLNQLIKEVTHELEKYNIVSAARKIEEFVVEDISHWYIRRIRNYMREPESREAKESIIVLGSVLLEVSKLMAPFVPFISERACKELQGEKESVHLEEWPKISSQYQVVSSQILLEDMNEVRKIVSSALEARAKAGIKVRQPIAKLKIKNQKSKIKNKEELLDLIKDEANIKEIIFDEKTENEIEIDTAISDDLKKEGIIRELVRNIQDLRKKAGLIPQQKIKLVIETDSNGEKLIKKFENEIKKGTNTTSIEFSPNSGEEIKIDELKFKIEIKK